jgi:hypothetical protein
MTVADARMIVVRLIGLKHALKLEMKGMKRSRGLPSAHRMAQWELGIKGSKAKVLEALTRKIEEYNLGILTTAVLNVKSDKAMAA